MTAPVIPWRNEDGTIFGPQEAATIADLDLGRSKGIVDAIRAESGGSPSPHPYPIRDPGPLPSDEEGGAQMRTTTITATTTTRSEAVSGNPVRGR